MFFFLKFPSLFPSHATMCCSSAAASLAALHKLQAYWLYYVKQPPKIYQKEASNSSAGIGDEKSLYCVFFSDCFISLRVR